MTVQQIVYFLNEACLADQAAMQALLKAPVPCNQAMLDHPTIVCWGPEETADGRPAVGLGGLLMGIAAVDGEKIASVWSDEGVLLGFTVLAPAEVL